MLRGMGEEYVQDNGKNGESCSKGGGGIRGGGYLQATAAEGTEGVLRKKKLDSKMVGATPCLARARVARLKKKREWVGRGYEIPGRWRCRYTAAIFVPVSLRFRRYAGSLRK